MAANIVISSSAGLPQFNFLSPDKLNPNVDTFGTSMVVLNNGNVVVSDPNDSTVAANAGAVFLYNGQTGALISELSGSAAGDMVGSGGITALTSGNFVVSSPSWQGGLGAVTWLSGSAGAVETVAASNSLVGSTANDQVGTNQLQGSTGVYALTNGNYVVDSPFWQSGGADVGAVTWGNGFTGTTGTITVSNSLVGATGGDQVGSQGVTPLVNGNYVVSSPSWQIGGIQVGAATWGSGFGATNGLVTTSNSLVGEVNEGGIATGGVTALSDGNYVVVSPGWDNGASVGVGAVTWGNGLSGAVGQVTANNSLIGVSDFDAVGQGGVVALQNGNYVVSSPNWHSGANMVGAVTWAQGNGNAAGLIVQAGNSLTGSTDGDTVGSGGITVLSNGNYVVSSPSWQSAPGVDVGAVTWGNGATGITGVVANTNSLVGSANGDFVGFGNGNPGSGVTALANGSYVVSSPSWNNNTGAVTWGKADGSTVGAVNASNSLVGSTAGDQVGSGGVTSVTNGTYANYVVSSPFWHQGTADVGAVTWGKGDGSLTGAVSTGNSLLGATDGDQVGSGGVTTLSNGNYIVLSPGWQQNGAALGAATWGNGATGQTLDGTGTIDLANSLIGPGAGAVLQQVAGLPGGNAFVTSYRNNGGGVIETQVAATSEFFAVAATQTINISPNFLTATLNTGASVLLQASNDITVNSPITVSNPGGAGGTLTLDAGRQVLIAQSITTGGGNLVIVANDSVANGVVDGQRTAGAAAVTMGAGDPINAANGNVTITLGTGAGNTNYASDDVTLADITGHNITLTNLGPGDASLGGTGVGSGVDMANLTASGNLVVQSTGDITQAGNLAQGDPDIINVAGTTRLTCVNLIQLPNQQNVFTGTVTYADPGGDVTIKAASNLTLTSNGAADSLTAYSGGIFTANDLFTVSGASSITAGTIRIQGVQNKLQGPVSLSSTGTINIVTTTGLTLNDLTLAGAATFNAPSVTFAGAVNVGSQTLTVINSAAHLNGATTIAGGTIADSAGIVIGSGATLSGFGTLQAGSGTSGVSTQIGASITPAITSGGLHVTGDLTLAPISIVNEQIQGTAQFSQIAVSGNVVLNNPTLQVSFLNPYNPAQNDQFSILSDGPSSGLTGKFAQGNTMNVGQDVIGISYSSAVNLVVNSVPSAPAVTVPAAQSIVANKPLTMTGFNVAEPTVQFGDGMTVQVTLSVQNGTLSIPNSFFLNFTQGTGTNNSTMTFTGAVAYVRLALASVTYTPAQDTSLPDTLTLTVNDLGNAGAGQPLITTKTVSLTPTAGIATLVADPVLAGKQDLVIQGTAGNDVVTVAPGTVANAYVVTLNGGVAQKFSGVNGRILIFDPAGNNTITVTKSIALPTLIVVGDGNNNIQGDNGKDTITAGNGNDTVVSGTGADILTLGNGTNSVTGGGGNDTYVLGNGNNTITAGGGNDTITVGAGSNHIDGGGGTNTLIESGNVDFTLVGGTGVKNGSLTKGAASDTLVLNHIQKVQLSLTGPNSHTIDGTAFAGTETLMAGTGNDTVKGGNGNDVLVGSSSSSGSTSIAAGTGMNLLIAGKGAATISAPPTSTGADLIIGGTTAFDANVAALSAIMAEWTSANGYALKIKHLMGTTSGGLNGGTKLTTGTVLNNNHVNTLNGNKGVDWFWSSNQDIINNHTTSETVTGIL